MDLLTRQHRFSFHEGYSEGRPYTACYRGSRAEISLISEGSVEFVVDGQSRRVDAPALTCQTYDRQLEVIPQVGRRTRTMWCYFAADRLTDADRIFLRALPPAIPIVDSLAAMFRGAVPLLRPIGEAVAGMPAPDRPDDMHMVRQALGAAIFSDYIRCASSAREAKSDMPPAVERVRRAIDEGYGAPWNLESLADVAQLNAKYLVTLFKRHLGDTPMSYLWRVRAEAGLSMLRQSGLTVEQIAFACGFQSAAHFSRSIKQSYGRSPRTFRNDP